MSYKLSIPKTLVLNSENFKISASFSLSANTSYFNLSLLLLKVYFSFSRTSNNDMTNSLHLLVYKSESLWARLEIFDF